jgi:MoaA/NifB/PqqE/SkfB family radical SAM enzyme
MLPDNYAEVIQIMINYVNSDILKNAAAIDSLNSDTEPPKGGWYMTIRLNCLRAINEMTSGHITLRPLQSIYHETYNGYDNEPSYAEWLRIVGIIKDERDVEAFDNYNELHYAMLMALENKDKSFGDDEYDILRI